MTRTFDASGKLPDEVVQALVTLDGHFRHARVGYVLIGALARDVVTSLAQNETPRRATKDVDLAIRVDSMAQFREVTGALTRVGRHEHKFSVAGLEIDVVPFGDIADDGTVEFQDSRLDVRGLAEAREASDTVRITDTVSVDVVSVAALSVLKTLAWRDRRGWTTKDAVDLAHLFSAVENDPYEADVWTDELAAALVDYDGSLVGAAWLGRRGAELADAATRHAVTAVLQRDAIPLAHDMGGALAAERLAAFTAGFASVE